MEGPRRRAAAAAVAALVAVLVAAGCGSVHRPLGANSSGRLAKPSAIVTIARTPIPTAVPVVVASTPRLNTPPPPPPVAGAPCRLPLAYISEAYGLFLDYPGGATEPQDPNSVVALPGNQPGAIGQNPGLTYLAATRTWIPVPRRWVAPSGAWYAYEDFNRHAIFAVTIPGQAQRTLTQSDGSWILFGVDDLGAYATQLTPAGFGHGAAGAWYLPFDGGPTRQLALQVPWSDYNGGALWAADPTTFNLVRYDLAIGVQTRWASFNSRYDIKGFDSLGRPLVEEGPFYEGGDFTLSAVDQGGAMTVLWQGHGDWVSGIVADAHGLWLESRAGIFLKTPSGPPTLVASGYVGHPAGPCL